MSALYTPGVCDFVSDHFPIAMAYNGMNIMSFNVMNENYKPYIHGKQGLKGSKLDKLTEVERCHAIMRIVTEAFDHGCGIVALQEVWSLLLAEIVQHFKQGYQVFVATNADADGVDYGVVITSSKRVCVAGPITTSSYQTIRYDKNSSPHTIIRDNYIMCLPMYFTADSQNTFTFVNTHVKFGEIGQLIAHLKKLEGKIIATGDFNVGFHDPRKESDAKPLQEEKEFVLWTNHAEYSHINTLQKLDLFDHFFTKGIEMETSETLVKALRANVSSCSLTSTSTECHMTKFSWRFILYILLICWLSLLVILSFVLCYALMYG